MTPHKISSVDAISRVFPRKFQQVSVLFPFPGMSLMIKICQTVSNISKYLWLVNFTSFIIRIFGGTLLFGPTVRQPVVSRLVLSGSRIRRVEQFHCIALFCSTRRHFYYVWRLRLLGCPRLILLHVQQFGKFKKLFVKSQWVKLLPFIIWLYEPHYFLSILTQCNKWEEFCFKEKKCLDHCTLTCSPNGRTKLQVQIWKKKFFGELLDNQLYVCGAKIWLRPLCSRFRHACCSAARF